MGSPFKITASQLSGLSPLKQNGGFNFNKTNNYKGKYHFENFEKREPKTYTTQEKIDLGMDAAAILHPGFDLAHAGLKAKEGKYGEAALYAGFSVIPGAAKPLVEGTKKALSKVKNLFTKSKTPNFGGGDIPESLIVDDKHPRIIPSASQSEFKGPRRLTGAGKEGITTQIQGMTSQGKYLDEIGYDASKMLKNKHTKFYGDPTNSERVIVEIALPDGRTQMFYKSSGRAGKPGGGVGGTTEDLWQPFMGYSDEVPMEWVKNKAGDDIVTSTAKANNWHIKGPGYEDFYGSESYRDIAEQLDRISVEEGWDMSAQSYRSIKK
jgi:hypothetical protein